VILAPVRCWPLFAKYDANLLHLQPMASTREVDANDAQPMRPGCVSRRRARSGAGVESQVRGHALASAASSKRLRSSREFDRKQPTLTAIQNKLAQISRDNPRRFRVGHPNLVRLLGTPASGLLKTLLTRCRPWRPSNGFANSTGNCGSTWHEKLKAPAICQRAAGDTANDLPAAVKGSYSRKTPGWCGVRRGVV